MLDREREIVLNRLWKGLQIYHIIAEALDVMGHVWAQIAGSLGIKHETVQKYLMGPPRPPVYQSRKGKLARYQPYIHQRFFQDGCRNSLQIFRKMQHQEYLGSSTIVVNYVTQLRQLIGKPSTAGPVMRIKPAPLKTAIPSPREIAWWFCLPASRLTPKQQEDLERLREADTELSEICDLTQTFFRLIRDHSASQLTLWIERALLCKEPELRSFVRGLQRDEAAVRAGLDLPGSHDYVA